MDHNILIIKGLTWENGPLRVRKVLLLKEHPFVQSRFEGMTRALGQNEFIAEDAEEPEGENESGRGRAKATTSPYEEKGELLLTDIIPQELAFVKGKSVTRRRLGRRRRTPA
jgi:hypothetical protein